MQVAPIGQGQADLTCLEHQATWFYGDGEGFVVEMPHKRTPSWGPHFGTLAYRSALLLPTDDGLPAVAFPDTSEAEDYMFAQEAVRRRHASLRVVLSVVTGDGDGSLPLFVCGRHGSNTWRWDSPQTEAKFGSHAKPVPAVALLNAADLAFAQLMRETGVIASLAARREASPAPNRRPPPTMVPNFFEHLYHPSCGPFRLSSVEPPSLRICGLDGPPSTEHFLD